MPESEQLTHKRELKNIEVEISCPICMDHLLNGESPTVRADTPVSDSDGKENSEVTALRKKIEDAFILSCTDCGATAQEHDACCAGSCGNHTCKSYFCSLCFKSFGKCGSGPAHVHVGEKHTGTGSFETRYDEFDDLDEEGNKTRWSYQTRRKTSPFMGWI